MSDPQLPDGVNIQNQAVPSLLLAGASVNPAGDDTGRLATQAVAMIDQAAQLEMGEIELSHTRREALISMIDDVVDDVDYLALFRQCSDLALTDDSFVSDTRLYDLLGEIDKLRLIRVDISSWPNNENWLSNLEHQAERVAEIRTRLSNEKIVKQPTGDHRSGDPSGIKDLSDDQITQLRQELTRESRLILTEINRHQSIAVKYRGVATNLARDVVTVAINDLASDSQLSVELNPRLLFAMRDFLKNRKAELIASGYLPGPDLSPENLSEQAKAADLNQVLAKLEVTGLDQIKGLNKPLSVDQIKNDVVAMAVPAYFINGIKNIKFETQKRGDPADPSPKTADGVFEGVNRGQTDRFGSPLPSAITIYLDADYPYADAWSAEFFIKTLKSVVVHECAHTLMERLTDQELLEWDQLYLDFPADISSYVTKLEKIELGI